MADNLKLRQPEDKNFINLREPWEIKYWTRALGVSQVQLGIAVKAVGNNTRKVKEYFGM